MEQKILISESAAKQVKLQLEKRGTPNSYLRLGVKGGGCSGLTYVIQFEDDAPTDKDIVFEEHNVKIITDKKSILHLDGTILDWEESLIRRGFIFNNPLEKNKCGCGISFST